MKESINSIYQYATSCIYNSKCYLHIDETDNIVISQEKSTPLNDLVSKILHVYNTCSEDNKPILRESIKIINDKLKTKLNERINSYFYTIFYDDPVNIQQAIDQIDVILNANLSNAAINEHVFRLRFLTTIPKHLNVSTIPCKRSFTHQWRDGTSENIVVDEWNIIEWLSRQVFQSIAVQSQPIDKRWDTYYAIMAGAYRGDHLLIEDDANHTKAKEFAQFGSLIRASSHCETGRAILGWDSAGHPQHGGNLRKDLLQADDPHRGISGQHIKHILFFPVNMRQTKSGELIYAKTARQVNRLVKAGNLYINGRQVQASDIDFSKKRHFLALQFEYAPDCEGYNIFDVQFYKHRLYGFLTYCALKALGVKSANVGPYGYGRTDEDPVIIQS